MNDLHFKNTSSLEALDLSKLPEHVAIIMDGNGRWAQERAKPRLWGHRHGIEAVRRTVEIAGQLSIQTLSLYAFSDENWRRSKAEISGIFRLLDYFINSELDNLKKQNVKLRVIGSLGRLPERIRERVLRAQETLASGTGMVLNIALSYGARSEIVDACRHIAQKVRQGVLGLDDISETVLSQHLWTSGLKDPDLLIRTSGEQRLSNFLLWQMAYTELCFPPIYWPDFGKEDFIDALLVYQKRKRRYGGVVEEVVERQG